MVRILCSLLLVTIIQAAEGDTRIATWAGDKQAAFILMFDDSLPTHVQNVIPLLKERGMTGTFYINPATGHYQKHKAFWEGEAIAVGMELGNHTMTHKGIPTHDVAEAEIGGCNEVIRLATPDQPWPRTVSWAKPGGLKNGQWALSEVELQAALTQHHLVARPGFGGRGAAVHLKTSQQMLQHVDKAIETGAMECIIFHGVGGDWISAPTTVFRELVDGLEERADRVWICTHAAAVDYAAQRDASSASVDAKASAISVNLQSSRQDDKTPLTLCTIVPDSWQRCTVTQGTRTQHVTAIDGVVRYEAVPGKDGIRINRR